MTEASHTEPKMIADKYAGPAVAERIDFINTAIHQHPEAFIRALEILGRAVTSLSAEIELSDDENSSTDASGEFIPEASNEEDVVNNDSKEPTIDTELSDDENSPDNLLGEFFSNHYDDYIVFDDETEKQIRSNATHQEISARNNAVRTNLLADGWTKSELGANPEAAAANDAVRRSLFGIYLGRVSVYFAENSPKLDEAI